MKAAILDGRLVAARVEAGLKSRIAALSARGIRPGLVVIRVGEDPASEVYVRNKARKAEELGIEGVERHFDASLSEPALVEQIRSLNADDRVDGILVQLPLPAHIDVTHVIEAIDPRKDVDGFHPINVGGLHQGKGDLLPCTPAGILALLDQSGVNLEGAHAVVVGRSDIVGKPVAALLLRRNATVTVCHSRSRDLSSLVSQGDVVVAAVGRPHLITGAMIKPGAVVIDVGINRLTDSEAARKLLGNSPDKLRLLLEKGSVLTGDVEFSTAMERASWITPVPGGVGPLTIAMLMANTVVACEARRG